MVQHNTIGFFPHGNLCPDISDVGNVTRDHRVGLDLGKRMQIGTELSIKLVNEESSDARRRREDASVGIGVGIEKEATRPVQTLEMFFSTQLICNCQLRHFSRHDGSELSNSWPVQPYQNEQANLSCLFTPFHSCNSSSLLLKSTVPTGLKTSKLSASGSTNYSTPRPERPRAKTTPDLHS
jgi:hypothetical protein